MNEIDHPGIVKIKVEVENLRQQIFQLIEALPYTDKNKCFIRMAYDGTLDRVEVEKLGLDLTEYVQEFQTYFYKKGVSFSEFIHNYIDLYEVYQQEVNNIVENEANRLYESNIMTEESDFASIYETYQKILKNGVLLSEKQLMLFRFQMKHFVDEGLISKEILSSSIQEHAEALFDLKTLINTNETIAYTIASVEARKAYLEVLLANFPTVDKQSISLIDSCNKKNITGNRIRVIISTSLTKEGDEIKTACKLIYTHFEQLTTVKYCGKVILEPGEEFEQFLCQTFEYFPLPKKALTSISPKIPKNHLLKLFRDLFESSKLDKSSQDVHRWVKVIMAVLNISGSKKTNISTFGDVSNNPPSGYLFAKP